MTGNARGPEAGGGRESQMNGRDHGTVPAWNPRYFPGRLCAKLYDFVIGNSLLSPVWEKKLLKYRLKISSLYGYRWISTLKQMHIFKFLRKKEEKYTFVCEIAYSHKLHKY